MQKDLGIPLLISCTIFGLISYNALIVPHYDVDPISILASLLNRSIPTLGYISGAISLISLLLYVFLWLSQDR